MKNIGIGGYYVQRKDDRVLHITPAGPRLFEDALRKSPSLTFVSILGNHLSEESAGIFISIRRLHPYLRTLCGLTHNEEQLDFSRGCLGPGDALLIAPELEHMHSLYSVRAV